MTTNRSAGRARHRSRRLRHATKLEASALIGALMAVSPVAAMPPEQQSLDGSLARVSLLDEISAQVWLEADQFATMHNATFLRFNATVPMSMSPPDFDSQLFGEVAMLCFARNSDRWHQGCVLAHQTDHPCPTAENSEQRRECIAYTLEPLLPGSSACSFFGAASQSLSQACVNLLGPTVGDPRTNGSNEQQPGPSYEVMLPSSLRG